MIVRWMVKTGRFPIITIRERDSEQTSDKGVDFSDILLRGAAAGGEAASPAAKLGGGTQ